MGASTDIPALTAVINDIDKAIKTNGEKDITGGSLNKILKNIVMSLCDGANYGGILYTTSIEPEHTTSMFYIASDVGTYFEGSDTSFEIDQGGLYAVTWNISSLDWNVQKILDAPQDAESPIVVLSGSEVRIRSIYEENYVKLANGAFVIRFREQNYYHVSEDVNYDIYASQSAIDTNTGTLTFSQMKVMKEPVSGKYPFEHTSVQVQVTVQQ